MLEEVMVNNINGHRIVTRKDYFLLEILGIIKAKISADKEIENSHQN